MWCHVDDVADLFIASLTSSKSENTRLIACAGRASWASIAEILKKTFPERAYPPVRDDALCMQYHGAEVIRFDTRLEEELLGGRWRTVEDAVVSCARDLIEKESRGWDKE